MLDDIASFPDQIKKSKEIIDSTYIGSIFKIDNIIISGMGGSSISGDIIQTLLRDRIDIPIYVSRDYDLPKWANKNTLVISQSYSGNTEETLSTFKHATQKHCKILGISSNGKLKEYCEKRQLPFIQIPGDMQPRASIGYMIFCCLYALKKIGVIKHDMKLEIDETYLVTKELINEIKKEIPEKKNKAKQLTKTIVGTIPQIYGWMIYSPIARRWATQINENGKLICRYDEVSECNHNDIVGWSMDPEISKQFSCILFRDHECETVYMSTRLDFMKKLYKDVAANIIEVHVHGKKRLAKMMYAMILGDFISTYIAIQRKIDPSPVEAIVQLKEELAKI